MVLWVFALFLIMGRLEVSWCLCTLSDSRGLTATLSVSLESPTSSLRCDCCIVFASFDKLTESFRTTPYGFAIGLLLDLTFRISKFSAAYWVSRGGCEFSYSNCFSSPLSSAALLSSKTINFFLRFRMKTTKKNMPMKERIQTITTMITMMIVERMLSVASPEDVTACT